jgi:hypothetical protein
VSLEQYEIIYNNINNAIFLIGVEAEDVYRIVSANAAYLRCNKVQPEAMIGKLVSLTTLVPVFNGNGICSHIIGMSRDITRARREEQKLEAESIELPGYSGWPNSRQRCFITCCLMRPVR